MLNLKLSKEEVNFLIEILSNLLEIEDDLDLQNLNILKKLSNLK